MKKLLYALVALALCSGLAMATVPDPTNCQVLPCDNLGPVGVGGVVVCPGTPAPIGLSNVTMTIKNAAGNVISGASISVAFGTTIINACAPGLPWTGTSNGSGVWQKNFNAGGCLSQANACVITANSVIIRSYPNVKSPDWNGGVGNTIVQANDFSFFGTALNAGSAGCSDYDNNGVTNLGDFIGFAAAFSPSHNCP